MSLNDLSFFHNFLQNLWIKYELCECIIITTENRLDWMKIGCVCNCYIIKNAVWIYGNIRKLSIQCYELTRMFLSHFFKCNRCLRKSLLSIPFIFHFWFTIFFNKHSMLHLRNLFIFAFILTWGEWQIH